MNYIYTRINEYLENTESDIEKLQFSFFAVIESGELFTEHIGQFTDKEKAIKEAEIADTIDKDVTSTIIVEEYEFDIPLNIVLDSCDYTIGEYKDGDISKEDLIEEYFNCDWTDDYKYYTNNTIYSREIETINKSSDILIDEVINLLDEHFGRSRFTKYTKLYKKEDGELTFESDNGKEFYEEDYEEYEEVYVRIADHTHNPRNGYNDINVVIANDDKTKDRFFTAKTDLRYTSDDDAEQIVDDIINFFK